MQKMINDDNCSVASATSTDSEWNSIQNKLSTNVMFQDDIDNSSYSKGGSRRPRMSIGTINTQREELDLVRQSMELDDELEYLNAYIDSMQENFKIMFGEVTAKQCIDEFTEKNKRRPKSINYYSIIEKLDLFSYPPVEWGLRIKDAIMNSLQ